MNPLVPLQGSWDAGESQQTVYLQMCIWEAWEVISRLALGTRLRARPSCECDSGPGGGPSLKTLDFLDPTGRVPELCVASVQLGR